MYAVYSSLDTDEPIMLLNQQIGRDPDDLSAPYIDGALFAQELFEMDERGYKCIRVFINTPGGNVVDGQNIVNAILATKTPVDTYNVGICASMGAVIFMTGRKRIMADYSSMMVHNPFGGSDNKMLNALKQSCVTLIAAKCNMTEDKVSDLMARETWLMPSECLEKGICTEIQATSTSNQKRMPKVSAVAMWREANNIQNNILNTNTMSDTAVTSKIDLSLISAYLELSPDASGASVLTALKNKVNTEILARTKAEDQLAEMKKAIDKLKADLGDMEDKYNAEVKKVSDAAASAKVITDKLEKEASDAKVEANKVSATAMVTAFVGKRIKTESVAKYVDMCLKTSIDEVKALLEELPLNGKAESIPISKESGAVDPTITPMNSIGLMAKIQAATNVKNKALTGQPQ